MAVIRAYIRGLRRWVRGMDVWERVRYMAVDMNVILLYHAGARRFLRAYSVVNRAFFLHYRRGVFRQWRSFFSVFADGIGRWFLVVGRVV